MTNRGVLETLARADYERAVAKRQQARPTSFICSWDQLDQAARNAWRRMVKPLYDALVRDGFL